MTRCPHDSAKPAGLFLIGSITAACALLAPVPFAAADVVAEQKPNRPPRLLFLNTAEGECPQADRGALNESRPLTIQKYRTAGADVIVKGEDELDEWLLGDGIAYAGALPEYQRIAYAKANNADVIGGIAYWSPPDELKVQVPDAEPQFRGWYINLRTCEVSGGLLHLGGTKPRAISLTADTQDIRRAAFQPPFAESLWTLSTELRPVHPVESPFAQAGIALLGSALIAASADGAMPDARRAFLGVQVDGRRLTSVSEASPAEAIGLRVGDELLVVGGHEIVSFDDVHNAIGRFRPGDKVKISWMRDGARWKKEVIFADYGAYLEARRATHLRQPVPDFIGVDSDGRTVRVRDYSGKIIILSFWAMWNGPSQVGMPTLQMTWDRFRHDDVVWINCSLDHYEPTWREYVKNNRLGGIQVRHPEWADALDCYSAPGTYYIDARGTLRFEHPSSPASVVMGMMQDAGIGQRTEERAPASP